MKFLGILLILVLLALVYHSAVYSVEKLQKVMRAPAASWVKSSWILELPILKGFYQRRFHSSAEDNLKRQIDVFRIKENKLDIL